MASVLVAVPAVAADPKMDYTATFDACAGKAMGSADFEDVPDSHTNAGDIDCIAYYGITRGTSETTYSPRMTVSREHMALFLTRLADLVGIEMVSDPDDAGFTDIGDLSMESQTAINQLADLGITQGTSATTYSPSDAVTRGQMALFIQRLMDQMDPFADPNAGDDDPAFAYIPKQVVDVPDGDDDDDLPEKTVMSPFTDLGSVTKSTYDAITALWELGVASGISDTAYSPSALITRASMAGFMAGVLDHSNARPAGVSAQVTKTADFGTVSATLALSVRGDNFAPMTDVSVKVFTSEDSSIDDDTGKCITDDVCDWSDNEMITDASGNNFDSISVSVDATDNDETEETWYAWMGDEDNSEFVKGSSDEAMVTLTAKANALGIRVTADINENATANRVDVGKDRSVVITAQLVDEASDSTTIADANAVAKEGVSLDITRTRGGTADAPGPDAMKTDADGKVTFTIEGPPDDGETNAVDRSDVVTFQGDVDGDTTDSASPDNESGTITVIWNSAVAAVDKAKADAPSYVIVDDDMVRIAVSVAYYDQYGNSGAAGDKLGITVGDASGTEGTFAASGAEGVRVRSNGTARFTANIKAAAGDEIGVAITALTSTANSGVAAPTVDDVLVVRHAHKNDDGVSAGQVAADSPVIVDADNDRFIIDVDGTIDGVLYSYDSGDTFIVDDAEVDMDKFEAAIATNGKTVTVVFYSTDGKSIFSVEDTA